MLIKLCVGVLARHSSTFICAVVQSCFRVHLNNMGRVKSWRGRPSVKPHRVYSMFADACLQCYRKSLCERDALTLRTEFLIQLLSPPVDGKHWWKHTHTEYLGVFLLNDQGSDIITSFLVVFGVCAVAVGKLSREQTNTYKSQPRMMIFPRAW